MIPLRDTIPTRSVPFVNNLLIAANVFGFLIELAQGARIEAFLYTYAFVPARLLRGGDLGHDLLTVVTAMFLHGGLGHLIGNLLYLWIFGDNVEDALGHGRYLVFYLACGAAATFTQTLFFPTSEVPNIGASGAIAGALGGYFVLYPRARVVTLVPLFFLFPLIEIPAGLYLFFWFAMQFFMGGSSLASAQRGGGVAWWAHVGGFLAGLVLVKLMQPRRRPAVRYSIR
jgi:membrane associated rhomboid family serine protease